MSTITEKVLSEAMALPADARITLVDKLLASLNLPTQAEIDRAWAEEAERRVSQVEQGEVRLISGDKVFEKIRKNFR